MSTNEGRGGGEEGRTSLSGCSVAMSMARTLLVEETEVVAATGKCAGVDLAWLVTKMENYKVRSQFMPMFT